MLGIIIPTDFHIFRGVETTNQKSFEIQLQVEKMNHSNVVPALKKFYSGADIHRFISVLIKVPCCE